jgi:hypothetical protein
MLPDFCSKTAVLLSIGLACSIARGADVLADFQPAGLESPHGDVKRVRFSTGLVELAPHTLVHSPPGSMRDFQFSEPVWVIGYRSSVFGADGLPADNSYLCHTFFGDQRVVQRQDQRMRALYSDGFTREVMMPEGFGVPFTPLDRVHWMPMFNNRSDRAVQVEMRIEVILIRDKDLKKALRPLYSTLRSVKLPHLFYVPPNGQSEETSFELPFDGRIHFIGAHIHPYAEAIELFNVTRKERVWKGSRQSDAANKMVGMGVYSSSQGYAVHAGDSFRLSSVYGNPTRSDIDAMAAVFFFYSMN